METFLDLLPLWLAPLLIAFIFVLALEVGYRIGKKQYDAADRPEEASVGTSVGALLGLLAFILAFTFGMAGERFENRRLLIIDEANALGTTYLRAYYLPVEIGSQVQQLLREYVEVKVNPSTNDVNEILKQSDELQDKLWSAAVKVAKSTPDSVMAGLFIQSLNEVIDIHAKRVRATLGARIPATIWDILFILSILSMASLGYHSGLGGNRCFMMNLIVVLSFVIVIYLIIDLDRPLEGLMRARKQALIDLQQKINKKDTILES